MLPCSVLNGELAVDYNGNSFLCRVECICDGIGNCLRDCQSCCNLMEVVQKVAEKLTNKTLEEYMKKHPTTVKLLVNPTAECTYQLWHMILAVILTAGVFVALFALLYFFKDRLFSFLKGNGNIGSYSSDSDLEESTVDQTHEASDLEVVELVDLPRPSSDQVSVNLPLLSSIPVLTTPSMQTTTRLVSNPTMVEESLGTYVNESEKSHFIVEQERGTELSIQHRNTNNLLIRSLSSDSTSRSS